jgi:hypothetical protein
MMSSAPVIDSGEKGPMMRIPLMLAFFAVFAASGSVAAQSLRTGAGIAEGVAPSQRAGEPAPPPEATALSAMREHLDADARACLDFVTNRGVMKCAEPYRSQKRVGH